MDFRSGQFGVRKRSLVRVVGVHVDPVKVSIFKLRQNVFRKSKMANNASIGRYLRVELREINVDEMKLGRGGSRKDVLCELSLERTEFCNAAICRQL